MTLKCNNTDTYNRILTEIIVCSTSNCVQMHQILKIANLSMNPFLHMTPLKTLTITCKARSLKTMYCTYHYNSTKQCTARN